MMQSAAEPDAWTAFAKDVECVYSALITIGTLFAAREADLTLSALKAGVERFTQKPVDATTLATLGAVHAGGVRLEGSGDGLVVHLTCLGGGGAAAKRARDGTPQTEPMRERRSFAMKPVKIGALPALLEKELAKLREAVSRFRRKHGASRPPPPLHAPRADARASSSGVAPSMASTAEGAAAADVSASSELLAPRDAAGALERPWHEGDAVDATNLSSFLRQQPRYRGQLVHTGVSPPRTGRSVALAELAKQPGSGAWLCASIDAALRAKGISALYSHQAAALSACALTCPP